MRMRGSTMSVAVRVSCQRFVIADAAAAANYNPPAMSATTQRFTLRRLPFRSTTFADDVRGGLSATQKALPPRWFYDALGSALFSAITNLPEYYVTRTEEAILRAHGAEIIEAIG